MRGIESWANGRQSQCGRSAAGCARGSTEHVGSNFRLDASLVPGKKWHGVCPGVCGAPFDVTWTGNDFQVGSFSTRCPKKGECLRSLADAAGTTAGHIKSNPLKHLAPWLTAAGRNSGAYDGEPEALPSTEVVAWWHERLMIDFALKTAQQHIGRIRGLTPETLRRYEIGYGSFHGRPHAFTHPVRNNRGELANLIESYWPDVWRSSGEDVKARTLAGRDAMLYPIQALTRKRGEASVLIVGEGRWKALVLNQYGFRAVTSTSGTYWNPVWTAHLAGEPVAVLYDVDAEHIARQRASELRSAGIDAWPVVLSRLGYSGKDGVDDAFLRGLTPDALRLHIARCRRWYLRAVAE